MSSQRIIGLVAITALLGACGVLGRWVYVQKQRANAKETQANQRSLWMICEAVKARSSEQLNSEAEKQGFRIPRKDAWGNPFQIEFREPTASWNGCVVISLGRDGRRGSCCVQNTGWRWDEDSVYAEGWSQTWNYLSSGAEIAESGSR